MEENYKEIVKDILENEEFKKTKDIKHHGITRYEHSIRVSYKSYKIAKAVGLDYKKIARAGLLHDFFLDSYESSKLSLFCNHPLVAFKNASKYYKLSIMERNIIESHMFPANCVFPLYLESWIVTFVDKMVAVEDYAYNFKGIKYILYKLIHKNS